MSNDAAPAWALAILEGQAQLRAEVSQLREMLERPRGGTSDDDRYADLLAAIAKAVVNRAFSGKEIMQHALLADSRLREALDAERITDARTLGQLFRRIEGKPISGVVLKRIGDDRDGAVWRVLRVRNPQNSLSSLPETLARSRI